ncbi:leucine-rich repeat flightless-interacting protein 1 isoform X11 [Anas acuta]|uniref:leucine-rich repeat flightless-interacting protein 1 isoform X11 n=1 Tax=Anas acuta TaxID=28680 RepID=UPI0035C8D90B
MGTQGAGRKRLPNRERLTAEDDALNQIAREAEARLAAKRAARAEAREIRMKELERQQKEIYQVQKKYYGLDTKWGDIEQWMEDSERYSRRARRNASASDEDERMSVGSRGSLRTHLEYASAYPVAGLENERTKRKNYSKAASYYPDLGLHNPGYASTSQPSSQNGNLASVYDESVYSGSRRYSASSSRAPSEYSCYLGSGSRASSRASSARASPVIEERPEKDFEKGARTVSSLSAATLASLGGTSSRRGSGDTSISADTEASIREIKDIYELKDQIQDVEGRYMQGLKEMKDSLAEVEEKYKKAMVSNAQLDNEKTNFMYQVDTLKDALLELEEQLAESRRQYEEKSKEFEREKHAHSILQFQFMEVKEALKQREEMLAEIQQLQQKQQSYVREISDLQETIEWKDKKIGALERQKDFFDSLRSERDDLRDEVVVLKEQLKKHGIIPDSDVATNGETSDILDNERHLDSSKTAQGTTQALKTAGDGMLGKANEVDMKNEILEDVGKREILQNTEHEEHKEESEEQEVQTLHADENTEAEKVIEETDAGSTAMLPDSRLTEQNQSLAEPVSGNASSNDDSDADDLRKEAESADTAAPQPVSEEAECSNSHPRANQTSEVSSVQGQDFESPQEMPRDLGTEHELEKAAPEQEEREDVETSHALSASDVEQAADTAANSCESVSDQPELPGAEVAGSLSEEVNVESHPETLQHVEESAEDKVTNVLEEKLLESKDCTDGTADEKGGDRAEEEDEVGNAVQGQATERDSVGLEGKESHESGVPADKSEKEEGGDQACIQPASSEDAHLALLEEQNVQEKTELKAAEEDRQKEVLMENLEVCSDSAGAGKQEEAPAESVGSGTEVKESVLQQAEPGPDVVKEMASQESSSDPRVLDDKIQESETEIQCESGKREESRAEQVEDLEPKVELQTVQCSKDTTGDPVGEKNNSSEDETQDAGKQEEGEAQDAGEQEEGEAQAVVQQEEGEAQAVVKQEEGEAQDAGEQEEGEAQAVVKQEEGEAQDAGEQEEGEAQAVVKQEEGEAQDAGKQEEGEAQAVVQQEEGEAQAVVKQEESESKEELTVDLSGNSENQADKETLKEDEKQLELANPHGDGFAPEGDANNCLAQKAEMGENISERVSLEAQAEEELEDDGDAFDFDEESKQILETDEKSDGEKADTQNGEDDGANGKVKKTAQASEAGKRTGEIETEVPLTEDDSLRHKNGDESGEAGHLQGEASSLKTDEKAHVLEDESKASDSNEVEKIPDVSEQDLESAYRAESKEDLQGGRRGKGKSRDDCTIS